MTQRVKLVTSKRVVIRHQWESVTPYAPDGELKEFFKTQVDNRFGTFPATMAKKVTEDQELTNGSRILQGDALWEAIKRFFEQYPHETLACSFCHYH
jgi:hypothetical protein